MAGVKGRSDRKGSYAKQLSKALGIVDKELPTLIERLIERAKDGDREALIYLIDRRLGKPKAPVELGGGEELGVGLVTRIYQLMAAREREIGTGRKLLYERSVTNEREAEGTSETEETEPA